MHQWGGMRSAWDALYQHHSCPGCVSFKYDTAWTVGGSLVPEEQQEGEPVVFVTFRAIIHPMHPSGQHATASIPFFWQRKLSNPEAT